MDAAKLTDEQILQAYARLRLAGAAVVSAADMLKDNDAVEGLASVQKDLMRALMGEVGRRGLEDQATRLARHLEKSVLGPAKAEA